MSRIVRLHFPLRRMVAVHALRNYPIACRAFSHVWAVTPAAAPPHTPRHVSLFSTTPHRRASEDPELQNLVEQQQKMLRLLQEKPELVKVVEEFAERLQAEGT